MRASRARRNGVLCSSRRRSRHRRRRRRCRCLSTIRAQPAATTAAPARVAEEQRSFPVWRTAAVCATMEVQRLYKGKKIVRDRMEKSESRRIFVFSVSSIQWLGHGWTMNRRKSKELVYRVRGIEKRVLLSISKDGKNSSRDNFC